MPVPIPQRNAIQNAWYFAKRYPIISGSVTFFALALIALLIFQIVKNYSSPEKQSPVDFRIESNYSLALLNKFGEKVGAIDVNPKIVQGLNSDLTLFDKMKRIEFYDVDGDGINEVFVGVSAEANSSGTANIRGYVLNHSDHNWTYKSTRELTFPNNPEYYVSTYNINELMVEDFYHDGKPEIISTFGSIGSFPSMIVKLDAATGKEIDWFYNPGSIVKLASADLNNDGIQEIIAVGINNSYRLPFIAVFDSRDIHGKAPSTTKYEPANVPLGTMKHYILIPPTKVGKYYSEKTHLLGSAMRVSLYPESKKIKVTVIDLYRDDKSPAVIEIIFDYDLKPLGITTGSAYDAAALNLYKKRIISKLPDKQYLQEYLQTVQYWDGKEFQATPTVNSHYLEAVSKKEGLAHQP
jgi:hypothetical protein